MSEKNKYILVLGSKPNSKLPSIEVSNIYAANGSSEIGVYYKKFYPNSILTSIVGAKEFERNLEVQRRILESSPVELICRLGHIDISKYKLPNNIKYSFFSNYRGLFFQASFLKKNILDSIIKETYYEKKIIDKIKHLYRCFRGGHIGGFSTGFFSALYALKKHPESQIILSGIGISAGPRFYKHESRGDHDRRSFVDRKLILCLKKKYISRLITTDIEMANKAGIQIWDKETIEEKLKN